MWLLKSLLLLDAPRKGVCRSGVKIPFHCYKMVTRRKSSGGRKTVPKKFRSASGRDIRGDKRTNKAIERRVKTLSRRGGLHKLPKNEQYAIKAWNRTGTRRQRIK